jgi:hypothetical protein
MLGGAITVKLAVAVLPVPPSADVTVTELFIVPNVVPVTVTEKVQLPLSDKVAPVRPMTLAPGFATMVPPSHDPVRPLGVATTSPAGSLPVKPTPDRGVVRFELLIAKVRVEV